MVSNAEGINSLQQYSIDLIGSEPWRDFITAAKTYADKIEQKSHVEVKYPSDKDRNPSILALINKYYSKELEEKNSSKNNNSE